MFAAQFADYPPMPLGILRVEGSPDWTKPPKLPQHVSHVDRILFGRVAAYRTVIMSEGSPIGPPLFYLNGQLYLNQTPDSIFQVRKASRCSTTGGGALP